MMGLRQVWGIVTMGVLVGMSAPAEAANRALEVRNMLRCQRSLAREGVSYANHVNWALSRCVRPLNECALGDRPSCAVTPQACAGLAADLADAARRLGQTIRGNCGGMTVDQLLGGGFRERMASQECTVASLDGFVNCFMASLREESGMVLRRLVPNACALLSTAGLAAGLSPEFCVAEETCAVCEPTEPKGPLYCGGADGVTCPDGFVCDQTDALCSLGSPAGRCVAAPTTCAPGAAVCGCDGTTYASDCARLTAGAVKSHDGACDAPPLPCGNGTDTVCPDGTFCDYSGHSDCGEGQPGVCRPMRADSCNLCLAYVSGQQCGCDMVTYPDDCARAAAGASKWFDGPCPQ